MGNHVPKEFHPSGDTTPAVHEVLGCENILSVQGIVFDIVT